VNPSPGVVPGALELLNFLAPDLARVFQAYDCCAQRRAAPSNKTFKEERMSYIEESLSKGEEIARVFKHHWMVKATIWLHFIFSLFTFGLWLPIAIYQWLKWRSVEQALTNKRVILKKGIFSRKTDEMRIRSIEAISISQGIIGRIFGFGSVTVTGRGIGDVKLEWMEDPMRVKREIESVDDQSPPR
jgi:membrane protein YdbS with pleckstrin-like domain